jgi:dTDP-4-amino-4,6-dideoxygalactose transaminase
MQFVDLAAQQQRIQEKIESNIQTVLKHGKYIMGPEVASLEKRLSDYIGVKHAISCSSGTDALLLALMAKGVGPGHAVFTTPFTFIATAEAISLLGATPVFVDIDPETFNINPQKLIKAIQSIETSHPQLIPSGIIPVDLFGLPADYNEILSVAGQNDMFVIADAAQSFGADYKGKKACALGHVACTSFFPAKPLGCYGDGGMCFCMDDDLAEIMRSLRVHGKGTHKYDNARIGMNGRLDTLQAAVLHAKFDIFDQEKRSRNEVAHRYTDLLETHSLIHCPAVPPELTSVWAQYSILAENESHRSALQVQLREHGIPTAIYYPKPLHLQSAFAPLGYSQGDFPVSEDYSKRIFALPMHPYLKFRDQERIAEVIANT